MKQSAKVVNARRKLVLEKIREAGKLSVNELAELTEVSELTMRRDLDYLVEQGLVQRYRGGARAVPRSNDKVISYDSKLSMYKDEKECIARYIASLIPEPTTIFLNAGTTTMEVIRFLKDKNITIITNNAFAFNLAKNSRCTIICTGGVYNPVPKSYTGELATGILRKIYAEYCVLGINGISAQAGVTSSVFEETLVNEVMIQRAGGMHIAAADSSKIGKIMSYSSLRLSDLDLLVTTTAADGEALDQIRQQNVRVVFADQELDEPLEPKTDPLTEL